MAENTGKNGTEKNAPTTAPATAAFDFSNVKAVKSDPKTVPSLHRTRSTAPNPLEKVYADSVAGAQNGYGTWLQMTMPGKAETVTAQKDGKTTTKTVYGPTVKKAMNYLRQAAAATDLGVSFRPVDNGDGTVTLHFQSKPKRGETA